MHGTLQQNVFLVKEHVGLFKAANNFDIYDPDSGQIVLECREDSLGFFTKWFRFTEYKRYTPFDIAVRTPDGETLVRVTRPTTFIRSHVTVFDESGLVIGGFRQKLLSVGGRFDVLGPADEVLCSLQGNWTGWNFRFVAADAEFAHVTKKWAGAGKELLTSADNYVLEISEVVPPDSRLRQLILAAVMCIDLVLKE